MDVYKFAKGIIALIVLMFIGTFIWSMYYVSKTIDETRHAPAVVATTAPAPRSPLLRPLRAAAAVPAAAPATPPMAVLSKPTPSPKRKAYLL